MKTGIPAFRMHTHVLCAMLSSSVMSSSATPWTLAHQAPLSMAILQARILESVAMPSSRGSSQPRDQAHNFYVFCTGQVGFLPLAPPGKLMLLISIINQQMTFFQYLWRHCNNLIYSVYKRMYICLEQFTIKMILNYVWQILNYGPVYSSFLR